MSSSFMLSAAAVSLNSTFRVRRLPVKISLLAALIAVNAIAADTILLTPLTLADGTIAKVYNQTVVAQAPQGSSLTFPVQWNYGGTLPPGLSLNTTLPDRVTIQGVPTTAGTFAFRLFAMDSGTAASSLDYTITIAAPVITVGPATLPPGIASIMYGEQFDASGGIPPYTFAVFDEQGAFEVRPTWMSSSGFLQFTTTVVGVARFRVQATDILGFTGTQHYQLTIAAPPLSIKPDQLPLGKVMEQLNGPGGKHLLT